MCAGKNLQIGWCIFKAIHSYVREWKCFWKEIPKAIKAGDSEDREVWVHPETEAE